MIIKSHMYMHIKQNVIEHFFVREPPHWAMIVKQMTQLSSKLGCMFRGY
jgi:hypothetical protein